MAEIIFGVGFLVGGLVVLSIGVVTSLYAVESGAPNFIVPMAVVVGLLSLGMSALMFLGG